MIKVHEKFKKAQTYLTIIGFSRSIKTFFEDIERCKKSTKNYFLDGIELDLLKSYIFYANLIIYIK